MDKSPLAEQKEIKEIGTKENKKGNNKYPYITSLGFGQVMGRYVVCNHQITLPPITRDVELYIKFFLVLFLIYLFDTLPLLEILIYIF